MNTELFIIGWFVAVLLSGIAQIILGAMNAPKSQSYCGWDVVFGVFIVLFCVVVLL